jgi:hypothetical protein
MKQHPIRGALMPPKGARFEGTIRDLCLSDADKWRRREIAFHKCELHTGNIFGFSAPGSTMVLIDTDGDCYEPRFSKPESSDTVCLGTPSKLKPWYRKMGYSEKTVTSGESVFFEYDGNVGDFFIFTEREWKNRES